LTDDQINESFFLGNDDKLPWLIAAWPGHIPAGKVSGQIHAPERVELHAGCRVQGDIKYGSIAIEHGARVLGLLLQVEADGASGADQDAQAAIRRAQA